MKRSVTRLHALLVALVAMTAIAGTAHAAFRAPQVSVLGGSLQFFFNGIGESINVATQQDATTSWTHTSSSTTGYTILIESSGSAASNAIGLYNGSDASPTLFNLLTGAADDYSFATATFQPGGQLTVNRFDSNALPIGSSVYAGVDPTGFGFYIQGPGGTFYTQDARNPGGKAQALAFKGTGGNAGTWFLCFEDAAVSGSSDQDYDDAVILMESVNTTPVQKTTWGQLKSRMR